MKSRRLRLSIVLASVLAMAVTTVPTANAAVQNLCRGQYSYECLAFSGYGATTGTWADARYPGSPNGHNCTRYAAYRLAKGGVPDQGTWGNAWEWATRAPNAKNTTPAVGAIAYWSKEWTAAHWGHSYGHVGVVEAVHANGAVEVTWDSYGDGLAVRQLVSGEHLPTLYLHIDNAAVQRSGGSSAGGSHNPQGKIDEVTSPEAGAVRVRGWAFDRDEANRAIEVHAYIGGHAGSPGVEGHRVAANKSRPDVHTHHGVGSNHGFDQVLETNKVGRQPVCFYAINIGGGGNVHLGCPEVTIADPNPFGKFDALDGGDGRIRLRGWGVDRSSPNTSLEFHVYQTDGNGKSIRNLGAIKANQLRDDVNRAHGVTGNHGFDSWLTTEIRGAQEICVFAINVGRGVNRPIGCLRTTIGEPPVESPGQGGSSLPGIDFGSLRES